MGYDKDRNIELQREMLDYYSDYASEFDKIYEREEKKIDLGDISDLIINKFLNLNVLELACGTGYWTSIISDVASSITAIDISSEMIRIARNKKYKCEINFLESSVYDLPFLENSFSALFAGFWWSHIPIQRIDNFLKQVHFILKPGAKIIMIDNQLKDPNIKPIRIDKYGNNIYKRISVKNSEKYYNIIKNFPDENFIHKLLYDKCENFVYQKLKRLWVISYTVVK